MMIEILRFLQWQCRRFEFWQLCFIFSIMLTLTSMAVPQPYSVWMNIGGLLIIIAFFSKWLLWDGIRGAWQRYKEERNKLLTTIRESDR